METRVSKDLCIGCGLCVDMAPELYHMDEDEKAVALIEEVPEELEEQAMEAAESCPTSAIEAG